MIRLKKKERIAQNALGTYPTGFRVTDTGRAELKRLNNRSSWFTLNDSEGAMHSALAMIQEGPTYKTVQSLLDDMTDFSNDPDKEAPAIKKAWDKALKEKHIEEY